jgi:hypothetical protein
MNIFNKMQEITVNGYSMSFPQKFVYPILGEPNCMAASKIQLIQLIH